VYVWIVQLAREKSLIANFSRISGKISAIYKRVFVESSGRFLFGKCEKGVDFLGLSHYRPDRKLP
jgi:hypothetical protein